MQKTNHIYQANCKMKFIVFIFLLLNSFCTTSSYAQNRFLFVQSESRQPFNITLNKKVYSSTETGYLIIPKLAEGKYDITLSFGSDAIPEQQFSTQIASKDVGYNLKNFGDKGWGLFNLQTFQITMAGNGNSSQELNNTKPIITEALNETAKANPVQPKVFEPEVPSKNQAEEKSPIKEMKETSRNEIPEKPVTTPFNQKPLFEEVENSKNNLPIKNEEKEVPQKAVVNENKPDVSSSIPKVQATQKVVKISEIQGAEAYYLTYVDGTSATNDTIQLLVPNNKVDKVVKTSKTKSGEQLRFLDIETKQEASSPTTTTPLGKSEEAKENTRLVKEDKPDVETKNVNARNSNCNAQANEDDFLKLRKTMAAAFDNDAMISQAKKVFKSMCFSTEQVKNLAYLFLTDETRYHFFDTAYPYVSDRSEFPTLAIMLSDTYYVNRFKAMLLN